MIHKLASAPVTLIAFALTAAGILSVLYGAVSPTTAMAPAFTLLAVNLLAALAAKPRLRVNAPLLVFHLALLALLMMFATARLIYFKGGVILSEGELFDGQPTVQEQGPWHPGTVNALRFQNAGFAPEFADQNRPGATFARIRWWDEQGTPFVSVIGDDRPLILEGYRIYTTGFRGFSPLLSWQPKGGLPRLGSVQLSDTSDGEFAPTNEWQMENGPHVWALLDISDQQQARRILRGEAPAETLPHELILRIEGRRYALVPGQQIRLDSGTLHYEGLTTWIGYNMVYEPLTPWMAATVLIGVLALVLFYVRKLIPLKRHAGHVRSAVLTAGGSS